MLICTAAAQEDNKHPEQPEPPKLIVICTAFLVSTAVAHFAPILLFVAVKARLACLSEQRNSGDHGESGESGAPTVRHAHGGAPIHGRFLRL